MSVVNVHEAKTTLSKLIAEALSGQEVVIAKGGSPVVRLIPVKPVSERKFGAYKGVIGMDEGFDDPLPPEELAAWGEG